MEKKANGKKAKVFFFSLSLLIIYLSTYIHYGFVAPHTHSHMDINLVCVCVCERKQRIDPPVRWRIYVVLARPKHAAMLKKISMLL